ncbi:putative membrane protein YhiD involved in acid resistance [Cytobacillus kochii]|nr:putative membrane protein YhiD involved in acid resistance [Cytobacillus kochii]
MATALIIMGISSNVLLSLGMVGALSIVRFRTPIKDPMDLVYLFWAIVAGILCGAGFIPLVIIGSLMIGLVLVLFVNKITIQNPYLLIVKYGGEDVESQLESLLSKVTNKHMMKSKSIMNGNQVEITYEVRMKKEQSQVVNNVTNLSGVESAVMLSYDGNFTA